MHIINLGFGVIVKFKLLLLYENKYTMWSNKYILILLVGIISLSLLLCYAVFYVSYHQIKIEVYDIFKEVVYMDIDMRGQKERIITMSLNSQQYSLDSLTIQQNGKLMHQKKNLTSKTFRKYCIIQRFLSTRVPIQIQVVDSLFKVALQQAGFPAQTVVKYSVMDGVNSAGNVVTYSSDISLRDYYPLPVFKMHDPTSDFTMNLQGFIKCPLSYLLKKAISIPYFWLLILAYIGSLFWIVTWSIKQKRPSVQKSSGLPLNDPQLLKNEIEIDAEPIVDIVTKMLPAMREWLIVVDNILFDDMSGEIKYNNEIVLQLKGLNLKLFSLFVKEKDICITYDRLKTEVWENQELDNKTVSIQINRLSKELSDKIDILCIENIRGVGYRLIVNKQLDN